MNNMLSQKSLYPAYSALALIAVQVGIGIVMKVSQIDGDYAFSPSSSVTISEVLKSLLSLALFYREWKARRGKKSGHLEMDPMPSESVPLPSDTDEGDLDESVGKALMNEKAKNSFLRDLRDEVSIDIKFGLCILALFYVLINNLIFVSYLLADPITIQLTKSGVTCITALLMSTALKTKLSSTQWIAVVLQVCGLVVTQYNPSYGAAYQIGTYLLLLFQVFLSATSGVFNQGLLQAEYSSLHANNVYLYSCGACVNFLCHLLIGAVGPKGPGFFQGYDSLGAGLIILNNVFLGLAINAVYKYADAVIKCLATAFATAILFFLSPIFFNTPFNILVLPGSAVVFCASWLYAANPESKRQRPRKSSAASLGQFLKNWRKFYPVLGALALIFTLGVVAITSIPDFGFRSTGTPADVAAPSQQEKAVYSPFNTTMAFIRWNTPFPERIPTLMQYEPFFHTVHISMPNASASDEGMDGKNLTYDGATNTLTIYLQVAHTMEHLLESQPDITGLFYYHFDVWVDPLAWTGMDLDKIHFPKVTERTTPTTNGPLTFCMTGPPTGIWLGWADRRVPAIKAASFVKNQTSRYVINDEKWCVGWMDIFYVPRRYFRDFIYLSRTFGAPQFPNFMEVAVPTIMHIIDNSFRENPYIPVVHPISDCWGDCCAVNPTEDDVMSYRCGHRLDYLNESVTGAFYRKLASEAAMLKNQKAVNNRFRRR